MQQALDALWSYTGEMFASDAIDTAMAEAGLAPDAASLKAEWKETVEAVLDEATLTLPESDFAHMGGLTGRHSEHLGHMLAEMQFLQRAYPGATW
jgi:ring-1,2-phenylacetyl-CoA epoxidase subunit PaaC